MPDYVNAMVDPGAGLRSAMGSVAETNKNMIAFKQKNRMLDQTDRRLDIMEGQEGRAKQDQVLKMMAVPFEYTKIKTGHMAKIAQRIKNLPTMQRVQKYSDLINKVGPTPIAVHPQLGPLGTFNSDSFLSPAEFAKLDDKQQMEYLDVVAGTAGEISKFDIMDKDYKQKADLINQQHANRLEEIRTSGEEARKTAEVRGKFGTAPSDEMVDTLAKQVVDQRLDPNMISKRGGLQQAVFNRVEQLAPGFNIAGANANIKYTTLPANLQSRGLIQGVEPLYEKLEAAGQQLDNSNLQAANKVKNWLKEKTGDPDIVAFNNLRDDVVAETERVLLGTGVLSDSKYQRALHNLNSAQSWPQMKAAINKLRLVVSARLEALDIRPFPRVNPAAPQERVPGSAGEGMPVAPGLKVQTAEDYLRKLRGQ